MQKIIIKGARTHNLKNLDLEIPRDNLVVITGLSGSGKSSLAFDTLYAEGQRRYVESLSTYARQFLSIMEKPDVDHIEGLSPAISIEQKTTSHNPRSTVGTVTEVYDYLRLLFARAGEPRCPEHKISLEAQTISQITDHILTLPSGTKIMLLAPIIRNQKGEHLNKIDELRRQGFVRARINNEIYELDNAPKLDLRKKHTIEVVVDRIKVSQDNAIRISDSLETATNLAQGLVIIHNMELSSETSYSTKFACMQCGYSINELEPRIFSFNSPAGACEKCDGLGVQQFMDADKIIFNGSLSLNAGAIRGWDKNNFYYFNMISALAKHYKFSLDKAFNKLPQKIKDIILYGNDEEIEFVYRHDNQNSIKRKHKFEGVVNNFERRYASTDSDHVRDELAKYLTQKACGTCNGARLNLGARNVFIDNKTLPTISNMSIEHAVAYFCELKLTGWRGQIADKILKEIKARLGFLQNVGLDYLSMGRQADTLSGGESQRIRLASQIGAGLVGVLYVLDEPSIGLHQRDNERLIKTLTNLRDLGNSVIVVEHDEDAILAADYVIDIGPGAGLHGGEVVAAGTPQEIIKNKQSLTGKYLAKVENIEIPPVLTIADPARNLEIIGANSNNLQNITISFPLSLMICVTGVSGSGKSTLINSTLYPVAAQKLNRAQQVTHGDYEQINGLELLDKVVEISQSPIGRTPRSNPATYTNLFTDIRDLFAATQEARSRGYKPGRFSFNVRGGRCEACSGDGLIKVEMHFLPDVYVPCDVCEAKRYNRETLQIFYKGKNIHEVLEMTVEESLIFFQAIPSLHRKLQTLIDVGLGYIKIGQSATTLSGGEAQRIKLAKELARRDTGSTLYILDEPTTGLHFHDVKRLVEVLQKLKEKGNTVIIIEHNLDVIKTADWIIDLGPEGGDKGGAIVATGTPATVARNPKSHTGRFLQRYFN